jgi:glutaminase
LKGLAAITTNDLSIWVQLATTQVTPGQVIERIPCLARANPSWFAVYVSCASGANYHQGDLVCEFPLMSVIKPFSLLYLLELFGAKTVLQWVDVKPSDAPFNSLEQLVADGGNPRNPLINSGAITLADKLPGANAGDRTQLFCQWLNQLAGSQLVLDQVMLASVRSTPSPVNLAIAKYLNENGHLENVEIALDTYEQICCLSGRVKDLALLGKLLSNQHRLLNPQNTQIVNAVMLTCGLYEVSSQLAISIGLPMKSGISGGLLAIVPEQGAIACYSPAVDSVGNSVAGLALIKTLSQKLQLSIFS